MMDPNTSSPALSDGEFLAWANREETILEADDIERLQSLCTHETANFASNPRLFWPDGTQKEYVRVEEEDTSGTLSWRLYGFLTRAFYTLANIIK
jgi:hypothetical protein